MAAAAANENNLKDDGNFTLSTDEQFLLFSSLFGRLMMMMINTEECE